MAACRNTTRSGGNRPRNRPGAKRLVLGNHDTNTHGDPNTDGMDETHVTLLAPGEIDLAITHEPLEKVPKGTCNVDGHLHQLRSPSFDHHIGISVEQLEYKPAPLEDIERLAVRLAAGTLVPGRTTGARLRRLAEQNEHDND